MAMNAADGTRHHSASRARLHDEMSQRKKQHEPGHMVDHSEEPKLDASKDVSHMDMHDVVAKHGPAEHIHMHHNDDEGVHTVHTHHAEGHHHHSEHDSREAAMDHAKIAQGTDSEDMEELTEPGAEKEREEGMSGGGIPGLGEEPY
jgi:hypothetical protein